MSPFTGVSKFGNPVYIYCPGRISVADLRKVISVEAMLRHDVAIQENLHRLMLRQTEELGRRIHQVTAVVDLSGLGMTHVREYIDYFKVGCLKLQINFDIFENKKHSNVYLWEK